LGFEALGVTRLGIEGVDVAHATLHVKVNDMLGFAAARAFFLQLPQAGS